MIERLKDFFQLALTGEQGGHSRRSPEEQLALAATALMIQLARVDNEEDPRELAAIMRSAKEIHGLSEEDSTELLQVAHAEADKATSLYEFTGYLNDHLNHDEKQALLTDIWSVALADEHVDKYEEHLIRRIADLFHLNHREYIECRLRAENRQAAR